MTFAIINRKQGWTVAGRLLLVSYLQLFCGSQSYGQQPDIDAAAAAKAAAGLEALTHGPSIPQARRLSVPLSRSIFRVFSEEPPPLASNRRGRLREATLTQTVSLTDSCGPETALSRHSMSRARLAPPPHTSARQGR